jgi:hypothetical protein
MYCLDADVGALPGVHVTGESQEDPFDDASVWNVMAWLFVV